MAGTYPDVPGYRFAYDQDGTQLFVSGSTGTGQITQLPAINVGYLNKNNISSAAYVATNYPCTKHGCIEFPG